MARKIKPRQNWLLEKSKKYSLITFTLSFLMVYRLSMVLIGYAVNKELFLESIWFWVIVIPVIYFLQWFLVVWVASKFTKKSLKQKFYRHPIATIILFALYAVDLPYRLAEYIDGGIVSIFETIVYYAFISFLWWLLICWISSKIFKKQRFHWDWYKKVIGKFFDLMPILYKLVLGLIIGLLLLFIIFILITVVFKYSGQDLEILFY